jgi:hypothetical protein
MPHYSKTRLLASIYALIGGIHLISFIAYDTTHGYGGDLIARGAGHVLGGLFVGYLIYSAIYYTLLKRIGYCFTNIPPLSISLFLLCGPLSYVIRQSPDIYLTYSTQILAVLVAAALAFFFWFVSIGESPGEKPSGTIRIVHTPHGPKVVSSGYVDNVEDVEKLEDDDKDVEEANDETTIPVGEIELTKKHPTADRLRVLKNLLDEGLISEDDYNSKKNEIISEL